MPFVYETVGGLNNTQANMLQAVLWIFTALSVEQLEFGRLFSR